MSKLTTALTFVLVGPALLLNAASPVEPQCGVGGSSLLQSRTTRRVSAAPLTSDLLPSASNLTDYMAGPPNSSVLLDNTALTTTPSLLSPSPLGHKLAEADNSQLDEEPRHPDEQRPPRQDSNAATSWWHEHTYALPGYSVQIPALHLALPFAFWTSMTVAALWHGMFRSEAAGGTATLPEASQQARDGRWDMVRFWGSFLVVYRHLLHFDSVHERSGEVLITIISRFAMTTISFVSGVFATGTAIYEPSARGIVMKPARLSRLFSDLVLINLTILPLHWFLSCMSYLEHFRFIKVLGETTPLVEIGAGVYWYLAALFIWQLITPILCLCAYPISMAFAVSVLVRSSAPPDAGFFAYFVFFVLGYVLAGGGLQAQERVAKRKAFEEVLTKNFSRAVAIVTLTTFLVLPFLTESLPFPARVIFSWTEPQSRLGKNPTSWVMGGWVADVLKLGATIPLMLSFVCVCFMLPASRILSDAGSRTLYIYVLHMNAVVRNGALLEFVRIYFSPGQLLGVYLFLAFFFALLLGSSLTERITKPFIQPRWLVTLLMPTDLEAKGQQSFLQNT